MKFFIIDRSSINTALKVLVVPVTDVMTKDDFAFSYEEETTQEVMPHHRVRVIELYDSIRIMEECRPEYTTFNETTINKFLEHKSRDLFEKDIARDYVPKILPRIPDAIENRKDAKYLIVAIDTHKATNMLDYDSVYVLETLDSQELDRKFADCDPLKNFGTREELIEKLNDRKLTLNPTSPIMASPSAMARTWELMQFDKERAANVRHFDLPDLKGQFHKTVTGRSSFSSMPEEEHRELHGLPNTSVDFGVSEMFKSMEYEDKLFQKFMEVSGIEGVQKALVTELCKVAKLHATDMYLERYGYVDPRGQVLDTSKFPELAKVSAVSCINPRHVTIPHWHKDSMKSTGQPDCSSPSYEQAESRAHRVKPEEKEDGSSE